MKFRAFIRLIHAVFILAREGLFANAELPGNPPVGAKFAISVLNLFQRRISKGATRGERLTKALTRLGPSYIKFGQFLATRPDIVGKSLADDLQLLQDQVPSFSQEEARAIILSELDRDVDDLFSSFSEPIAAASIAQVHRAVWVDSDGASHDIAIKLMRPGVQKRFQKDLQSFYIGAELAERFLPDMDRLKPVSVVDILKRTTTLEMDLRIEASAISEFAENIREDSDFKVPDIYWDFTNKNILATEWIEGIPLSHMSEIKASNLDLPVLARTLIQSFLRHAVRDGFFHADMHPGNLIVQDDGTVCAIDLGIMGRLKPLERQFLAEILYGFVTRNYIRIAEAHFEAGYVPDHHSVEDFAQALRAIGEPIHGRTADDVSMAKLLGLLFEITELFDMATRPELILLQKTMVVVEGVGRILDPHLNMWEIAAPVMRQWIEQHLGVAGHMKNIQGGIKDAGHAALILPKLALRAERISSDFAQMAEHGLRFDRETAETIGKAEAKYSRSGRVALWIIALSLAVMAMSHWN